MTGITPLLRLLALILGLVGGMGNLILAAWLFWKKSDPKRGMLHMIVALIAFSVVMIIF